MVNRDSMYSNYYMNSRITAPKKKKVLGLTRCSSRWRRRPTRRRRTRTPRWCGRGSGSAGRSTRRGCGRSWPAAAGRSPPGEERGGEGRARWCYLMHSLLSSPAAGPVVAEGRPPAGATWAAAAEEEDRVGWDLRKRRHNLSTTVVL